MGGVCKRFDIFKKGAHLGEIHRALRPHTNAAATRFIVVRRTDKCNLRRCAS